MSDAPSTGRVSASRSDELDIDGSARDSLARTIADNATAALFMMDTRGRCTYMNAAAEAMIGYRLEEIRDLPLHDAIHHHHPDGRPYPLAECPIDRALPEKNQVRRHEDVFIRKDGAYFPVLCAAEPIIRDGVPVGTVIEVRDVTEEKRAEAERKQAEESLKLQARVLESMSEGVSLTDEHGFILYTNPAEDAMFGYEPGELVGQHVTVQNTYPPEENTRIVAAVIQDLKARGSWEGEFHNRKKDGSPFITRARITSLEIGGKQHWVCVQEDITERKRADAALRESDERFRATFSQAAVGMCHLGLDGRWLWMNQKLCDIVGYTHQELRERTFTEITSPEDQAVSAEWFQRLLRGTVETYSLEMRYVRKDGSPVWVQVTVSSAREPSGAPHFFIGVVEDITRRKESEQRLREETRIVETVNRIGQTLAAELDLHKLLQSVTDAATEITGAQFGSFFYNALREDGEAYLLYTLSGAPMEAFSGFPIPRNTAIFEPTFRGEGVERLDDVTRDPRFAKNPPYHGMPEGHLPVRSYLAVPVTSRTGEGIGGLFFGHGEAGVFTERHERIVVAIAAQAAIAVDNARLYKQAREAEYTARRQAEELAEADRRKDQFLAMLGHELRNPLGAISNAAHLLNEIGSPLEPVARVRATIERQVRHLSRMVDDLLDVSRLTHGQIGLRIERLDLNAVVANIVQSCRTEIDRTGQTLSVRLPREPLYVEGDAVRLEQVFCNLLTNAAKYTDPGGSVHLAAELRHEGETPQAVVRVTDTGIGIAPELLPRVFDLFVQAEQSLDRTQGGLGLGLTLVKRLVELHGGAVEASSEGPGRGSEFVVRLPLAEASRPEAPFPVAPAPPSEARPARVLIVEDNQDAAETMGELVSLWGHEVRVAHDGAAALAVASAFHPEVVLLDIGLPRMDGYAVAEALREREEHSGTLLVALTGYGQDQDRQRAREAGFDHHLTKPANPEELLRILASSPPVRA